MERTVKIVLAISIVASLLLALAPAAVPAAEGQRAGGPARTWSPPEEMYLVISAVNTTPEVAYFEVMGDAVRTADGRAMSMNFSKPLPGQYYFDNDTAVITRGAPPLRRSPGDRQPVDNMTGFSRPLKRPGGRMAGGPPGDGVRRPIMGDYGNATLNVAGASAVVAMKNLTSAGDNRTMQSSDVAVYLPGGNLTAYTLGTPVTISHYNRTITIAGNPEFGAIVRGVLAAGDRFPAGAQPVRLVDIGAKI